MINYFRILKILKKAKRLVDEQAKDEGLWFIADNIVEAYFQQELRKLHAIIDELERKK